MRALHKLEEGAVAFLLAATALVSFSQVVARYVFNSGWVWALELTQLMFAWMIIIGMSWAVRERAHLGVDFLARMLPPKWSRAAAATAAAAAALWAILLIDTGWLSLFGLEGRGGAIEYVAKMKKLGLRTEDLGAPRWLAYLILPLGLSLFAFRCAGAAWRIARGRQESVIASHEKRK